MKRAKLADFDLMFVKYNTGNHKVSYELDDSFFQLFDYSSLTEGKLNVEINFTKDPQSLQIEFVMAGNVKTNCDRCLSDIDYPIKDTFNLLVKITQQIGEDEENLTYILPSEHKFNIATYLIEMAHLAIPMRKTCDDIESKCDETVLQILNNEDSDGDEGTEDKSDPAWAKLKNLFKDK